MRGWGLVACLPSCPPPMMTQPVGRTSFELVKVYIWLTECFLNETCSVQTRVLAVHCCLKTLQTIARDSTVLEFSCHLRRRQLLRIKRYCTVPLVPLQPTLASITHTGTPPRGEASSDSNREPVAVQGPARCPQCLQEQGGSLSAANCARWMPPASMTSAPASHKRTAPRATGRVGAAASKAASVLVHNALLWRALQKSKPRWAMPMNLLCQPATELQGTGVCK